MTQPFILALSWLFDTDAIIPETNTDLREQLEIQRIRFSSI